MREIKFRLLHDGKIVGWEKFYLGARNKETGEWAAIPQWLYSSDGEYWNPDGGGPFVTEREQFTGLKDYNMKDIYEGDVLDSADRGQLPHIVTWGHSSWEKRSIEGYALGDLRFPGDYKIIGNIHSNPELLKGADHD